MTKYTVDFFIEKFSSISENVFNVGNQNGGDGTHCALGLCNSLCFGLAEKGEYGGIVDLFAGFFVTITKNSTLNRYKKGEKINSAFAIAAINNGETEEYQQPTPKQRILAALYDIKAMQQPKEPIRQDITKSLAILPIDETSDTLSKKEIKIGLI